MSIRDIIAQNEHPLWNKKKINDEWEEQRQQANETAMQKRADFFESEEGRRVSESPPGRPIKSITPELMKTWKNGDKFIVYDFKIPKSEEVTRTTGKLSISPEQNIDIIINTYYPVGLKTLTIGAKPTEATQKLVVPETMLLFKPPGLRESLGLVYSPKRRELYKKAGEEITRESGGKRKKSRKTKRKSSKKNRRSHSKKTRRSYK
jgi:hypothetical protein